MHRSVTSSVSRGRRSRNVRSSADVSMSDPELALEVECELGVAPATAAPEACGEDARSARCCGGAKFIDTPEIDITRDENLNTLAVVLEDRGRDVHGALE